MISWKGGAKQQGESFRMKLFYDDDETTFLELFFANGEREMIVGICFWGRQEGDRIIFCPRKAGEAV